MLSEGLEQSSNEHFPGWEEALDIRGGWKRGVKTYKLCVINEKTCSFTRIQ